MAVNIAKSFEFGSTPYGFSTFFLLFLLLLFVSAADTNPSKKVGLYVSTTFFGITNSPGVSKLLTVSELPEPGTRRPRLKGNKPIAPPTSKSALLAKN